MAFRWAIRRKSAPPELLAELSPDERLLAAGPADDDVRLAASRFGLWVVEGGTAIRWDWHLISRAVLRDRSLSVVRAAELDRWPDGTAVLVDLPARELRLTSDSGITDVIHTRVRRSVAASAHLDHPGAGGWVVLRRIAGRDGLSTQIRLDPGADPDAFGFAEAVAACAEDLRGGEQSDDGPPDPRASGSI